MSEEEEVNESGSSKEPYKVPARATRGQRMSELVGDALEADEEFWGQNAWKELSDDEDIQSDDWSSEEKEDVEDSDIDDVDEEAEEKDRAQQAMDLEAQEKKRVRNEKAKKRKGIYVDPALKTSTTKNAIKRQKPSSSNVILPSGREMRASTKVNTIATTHALMHDKRQTQHRRQSVKSQKDPVVKLTQQELLEEAARTEIENRRSLELLLMFQEEKKRDKAKAEKLSDPRIVYFSSSRNTRRGPDGQPIEPIKHSVTFTQVENVPSYLRATAPPVQEKAICSVTGLPAKYRDPQTGIPYRTLEAFKVIRSKVQQTPALNTSLSSAAE